MLKLEVDFKSFFKKGVPVVKDDYLVALINGAQGSGKTYFAIYNVERKFKGSRVYTNIHSYKSNDLEVVYFTKLEELYDNHDLHAIFIIDELSKIFVKESKIDRKFYSWLNQCRKHNRYVYMITQEYMQVPNWLRGVASLVYTTNKIPLTPFVKTTLGYPVLDNDTFEWGLQESKLFFYKRNKSISDLYDTFETIDVL